MQITVFGASGQVGRLVVRTALDRGHMVTAFVHSQSNLDEHPSLLIKKGDVADGAAVAEALQESDAVISTLGSWQTKSKDILTQGMQTIIPAMQANGSQRIVTLTGSGALWSQDKPGFIDRSGHLVLGLIAPKILRDGEQHLRLLEASDLDWTCVRSPVMRPKGLAAYRLDTQLSSVLATIPKAAVATAMVDLAESTEYLQQAPVIHRT